MRKILNTVHLISVDYSNWLVREEEEEEEEKEGDE